jgi:hypothetical protein
MPKAPAMTARKRPQKMPLDTEGAPLAAFLDRLAGRGKGRRLVERVGRPGADPAVLAREVARSPAFERLYKEARTVDIGTSGRKEADPAYVGLPPLDSGVPFETLYRDAFRPRLAQRAEGFAALFGALAGHRQPLIVETGCLRIPGNWQGDGQSTFQFDAYVRSNGGHLVSIDILPESIDTARRACSSAANLVCNDSVAALYALSRLLPGPAALVYLDSYDLDLADPMPSAIHHALELAAVRPLLGPGSLVCIDDYGVGDQSGGKGLIVDRFFTAIRATVLHSGYQKLWRVP